MSPSEAAEQAGDVGGLLEVVQEFVKSLPEKEASLVLPFDARLDPVTPEHIREAAVRLASVRMFEAAAWPAGQVERLFEFYTAAATRLGHLQLAINSPADSRPQSR